MNAKDEINRAIGVVKARMDYLINHENFENEEYEALCRATCSLEKWRDDDCTHYLPEIARTINLVQTASSSRGCAW